MISIADTLRPEQIRLELAATDLDSAIRETAALLHSAPAVLDWDALLAHLRSRAPCIAERDCGFGFCLPHARTDAVSTMVMSLGIMPGGLEVPGCPERVRYVFCIAVPQAMDSDYLRIVGLLTRTLKNPAAEQTLRAAASPAQIIDELAAREAEL